MAFETRYRAYSDFRTARYSKLYWLDVEVALRGLFYRRRAPSDKIIVHPETLRLEYCVLEGSGAVASALTIGPEGMDFDRFVVCIAGHVEDGPSDSNLNNRSSARMIWTNMDDSSPRLDIYIPNSLSRHLVELFVTKRIDRVQLSIQIAVIGEDVAQLEGLPDGFPLLGPADRLYFRRTQCELLSVYTSLGKS
jgi:hypothetical protein